MSENSIIKHLCNRDFYTQHRSKIKLEYISKELHPVFRTLDGWYGTNDEGNLSVDDLSNLYFVTNRTKPEFYQSLFEAVKSNEASELSTVALVDSLHRVSALRDLSLLAYDASEGYKSHSDVLKFWEEKGLSTNDGIANENTDEISYVSDDLAQLIATSHSVAGLRHRNKSLNESLGSLRKGDFGFIFARPETGKTTFLASECTYMAQQASGPILWLNNEEQSNKVMLRCYQAALELSLENLLRDIEGCSKRFHELIQGRLRIYDILSASKGSIEKLIEKTQPSLVVFDQIDKIKGFDNDREDLRLGSIYIWARELAKQYCPVIGVCQADGTGEGQRWLTMANVANAKTSKQAEADWILGIGKVSDPGYENLRYMHLSKNKLLGDSDTKAELRHARWEMLIDPTRALYIDL